MENKFISEKIISVVRLLESKHPDIIFCGSFGLVLNGLLHREVKDLDIITQKNYYGTGDFFGEYLVDIECGRSERFMVGKNRVVSFKLLIDGISIDVLYNLDENPTYNVKCFDGLYINVEEPESAIKAKKGYLQNDRSVYSAIKHLKDLIYLGIDKYELVDLINNSNLVPKDKDKQQRSLIIEDDLPF